MRGRRRNLPAQQTPRRLHPASWSRAAIGTLGLNPKRCKNPSVIIIADKIQLYPPALYARGMDIVTVPTVRNLHSALNPAIKSLNYLNNILAKIEANNAGCEEAVMLNAEGFVAECTGDNLFIVKKRQAVDTAAVGRRALRHHATGGDRTGRANRHRRVGEPNLTRYDLFNADECFLTGTGAEIVPVVKIDGRVIGTGKPGAAHAQAGMRIPRLDESVRRADIQVT